MLLTPFVSEVCAENYLNHLNNASDAFFFVPLTNAFHEIYTFLGKMQSDFFIAITFVYIQKFV